MTAPVPVQSRPLTVAAAALAAQPYKNALEATKARYAYPWWKSNDPFVIAERQLREPVLLVEFSRFHEAVEQVLGRSVEAHEFMNAERLLEEIAGLV